MAPAKHGNRVKLMGYYSPESVTKLQLLSETTRVPQSVYLREALEDLLKKYSRAASRFARVLK